MPPTPKRVLFINPFAQRISGPDKSLVSLIRHLDRERFEPFVWIPKRSPFEDVYKKLGAVVIIRSTPAMKRSKNPLFLISFVISTLFSTLQCARMINRYRIDLVHTNMEVIVFSGLAARITGRRSVYHVRGTSFYRPRWLGRLWTWMLERLADRLICISEAVRSVFNQSIAKHCTIYNPIDPEYFVDGNRKSDTITIATSGRINPRKDLKTFVEAAIETLRARPRARVHIAGEAANSLEATYFEELRSRVQQSEVADRFRFLGFVEDMPLFLKSVDIFCLVSISEGFGRSLAEASAAGCALVASDIDGLREIVEKDQSGILVPVSSPQKLHLALLRLIDNTGEMRTMGTCARKRAEALFSAQRHADSVMKTYEPL